MAKARWIQLDEGNDGQVIHFIGDRVDARLLADGRKTVTMTVTRTGNFYDPRYGDFDITHEMLLSMVRNFDAGVFGQEVVLDVSHQPSKGAAGFFRKLFVDGNKLRAEIELTEYGIEAIRKRGMIYLSADYSENFQDNESRQYHGPTLKGAALTPRPVIKRLDPVQLSEETLDEVPTLISDRISRFLSEETKTMWEALLKLLRQRLGEHKLSEALIAQLVDAFNQAAQGITEEAKAKLLMESFATTGKSLAEQIAAAGGERDIKLDLSGLQQALAGIGTGMTPDAVTKLLDEREQKRAEDAKKLAEQKATNVNLFNKLLEEAKLEGISDEDHKMLADTAELITPEMSEDQVRRLAEQQITVGNRMAAQAKLVAMGYEGPQGSTHITVDDSNAIKSLQETVDRRLGILDRPDSRRFERTGGVLLAENKQFAERVLAQYDRDHGRELAAEHKQLAGGDGIVSDVSVPASWERTVIREALYQLVGLQFCDVGVEAFNTAYSIPYSYRDTSGAGINDTRKFEGQGISRAGVIQTAETAYNTPQKLAFEVSDELRYLTQQRHLNWETVAENQRNASRIIGEDSDGLVINEQLQASDEYLAAAVANEDLELQADDVLNVFILAHFPVVRPRAIYDLQGNQVGSTVNPITVTYNAVALSEYDGTGTQAAGTYYSIDYNLGEIRLVDESGAVQVPANATAYTINYSYATNVYNFDSDLGTDAMDVHWDTFLYRYGLRKSVIEDDRYHMANFGLMRGAVMTQIEQAKQFGANSKRPGSDLSMDGSLGRIKDVPNFKAFGPSLWMADHRVILGERGTTRFRMAKAWTLGELQDQRDSNGRFTGKKEAYGDQFIVVHTPSQLKRALTSINVYSASARVARTV